jgi:hypothetical protein
VISELSSYLDDKQLRMLMCYMGIHMQVKISLKSPYAFVTGDVPVQLPQ